ncbi:hypothetical protein KCP69_24610 [Salmonella enterica subsp. enterica]|nr:hypothetical protein KCP69_24610 [Salmonella enterica subsp. enterica]
MWDIPAFSYVFTAPVNTCDHAKPLYPAGDAVHRRRPETAEIKASRYIQLVVILGYRPPNTQSHMMSAIAFTGRLHRNSSREHFKRCGALQVPFYFFPAAAKYLNQNWRIYDLFPLLHRKILLA